MGTVFRKQTTRALPSGADIFTKGGQRFARWKAGKRTRTAKLTTGRDGSERIVTESPTWLAKYRDGQGIVCEVSTGCKDETAARAVLAGLERRAELVQSGLMTTAEDAAADHHAVPLVDHLAVFAESMKAKECSADHQAKTSRYLKRLADECGFRLLGDLRKETFERWLVQKQRAGWSARNRNAYQTALVTFARWCVENGRLMANSFAGLGKANEQADRRRIRRALTEDELGRLLSAARQRPLLDAMTIRRGKRKGQTVGKLRDDVRDQLERLGRERELIYKTLALTGLRKSELASLTVGQLHLDGERAFAELNAGDAKNRTEATIPLRRDLADELRAWLAEKAQREQADVLAFDTGAGLSIQRTSANTLAADTPLFRVPVELVKILNRDLKRAGIPKLDERGRVLDVHCLRGTFATLLSKGGIPLRTAQAAMRHSDPKLTANVYCDPFVLDVHSALDALPRLPLDSSPIKETQPMRATGTDDFNGSNLVAPAVAPTHDFSSPIASSRGKMPTQRASHDDQRSTAASVDAVNKKRPLSSTDNERSQIARPGFEPGLSDPESLVLPLHHQAGFSLGRGI